MSDDTFDLNLLDQNLADIEDLPSFEVPPAGTYQLLVSLSTKTVNEHPAVAADLEIISTVQLANSADTPAVDGTKFGLLFMLDNEFGLGNMKKFLAPFAEHFGTDNVRELVTEKVQNVQITATVKRRVDKEDKEKVYAIVTNIVVA